MKIFSYGKIMIDVSLKDHMIQTAQQQHGYITPVFNRKSLYDSFSIHNNVALLWFNDSQKSTHMIRLSLKTGEILSPEESIANYN
jgi:ABC-type transporter Mla maintaining outer membrane lipid asymmetry ATPase subunit MlaF